MALIRPRVLVSEKRIDYDGRQLRSHFLYDAFGVHGDAAVAFVGAADVRGESLVDLADKRDGLFIAAESMLHVIYEGFGPDLDRAVLLQRLLVVLLRERLLEAKVADTRRVGDDLWVGTGKLTVSIATVSAVSTLVHVGVNTSRRGTPVETAALEDLGIEPRTLAAGWLDAFADEIESMARASTKVRSVP